MSVWVIELPHKKHTIWHMEIYEHEERAKHRLKVLAEAGYKNAMCWDMVSGVKLA